MAATAPIALQPRRAEALAPRPPRLRSLSPDVVLVANANASGLVRRPELVDDAARALRSFGARVESRLTESTGELADVLGAAERRVVLLGGDGSLHAAANAEAAKPELALLPAGRANNVARTLGVPTELAAAARLAVEGRARRLDAIVARTSARRYLAVEGVSVGFHALARADYRAANSADTLAGVKAGLGALARFRPVTVALDVDGVSEVTSLGQLFVANLPLFGPGLRVAPADPGDGLLDLVTIPADGRAALVAALRRLRRGTHLELPGVRHVRAKRIRIAPGVSPVIADTANLGSETVDLSVAPAALQVVGAAR
jgi:diacylglycerol kinase (ATP)